MDEKVTKKLHLKNAEFIKVGKFMINLEVVSEFNLSFFEAFMICFFA